MLHYLLLSRSNPGNLGAVFPDYPNYMEKIFLIHREQQKREVVQMGQMGFQDICLPGRVFTVAGTLETQPTQKRLGF